MHIESISLIGSGGHALVVLDSLAALGMTDDRIVVLDQNPARAGQHIGNQVVRLFEAAKMPSQHFHICIGNNESREKLALLLQDQGCTPCSIVDPRTIVAPSAHVGEGSFLAPGAIVAARASIGRHCIVNHGAIIDHECDLEDFVHVAPGATLAGGVTIGLGTLVGAGANILPCVSMVARSTLGAGAVLVENASEPAIYIGIPARKI